MHTCCVHDAVDPKAKWNICFLWFTREGKAGLSPWVRLRLAEDICTSLARQPGDKSSVVLPRQVLSIFWCSDGHAACTSQAWLFYRVLHKKTFLAKAF